MKTSYLVGGLVALGVVLGGAWLLIGGTSAGGSSADDGPANASGSIAALVKRGGSWQCTVNHQGPSDTTSGVVFISDKNIRGDFDATVPQAGKVQAHMISDGIDIYIWTSVYPTGFKSKVAASGDGSGATSGGQDFYNQSYDYDCQPWTPDNAKFIVPSNVTFMDASAAVSGGASAGAGADMSAVGPNCAMCDQAGPGRDQCRAAMGCK